MLFERILTLQFWEAHASTWHAATLADAAELHALLLSRLTHV